MKKGKEEVSEQERNGEGEERKEAKTTNEDDRKEEKNEIKIER